MKVKVENYTFCLQERKGRSGIARYLSWPGIGFLQDMGTHYTLKGIGQVPFLS